MALKSVALYFCSEEDARDIPPSECIEILYMRKLGRIGTPGCSQVNIWLTGDAEEKGKTERFGTGLDYYSVFDFAAFAELDTPFARKKVLLDALSSGLLGLCGTEGWDPQPFREAYDACIAAELKTEWFFREKLFRSPNRKHYFGMLNVSDLGRFEIFEVLFDDRKNEVTRRKSFEDRSMVFGLESAWWTPDSTSFCYKFSGPKRVFEVDVQAFLAGEGRTVPTSPSEYFRKGV